MSTEKITFRVMVEGRARHVNTVFDANKITEAMTDDNDWVLHILYKGKWYELAPSSIKKTELKKQCKNLI